MFGALCWLPDYLRARAGQAGVAETGDISVWERPTRVAMPVESLQHPLAVYDELLEVFA